MNRTAFPCLIALGVMLCVGAYAADPRKPSAAEIVNQLSDPPPSRGLTRGFGPTGRNMTVEAPTAPAAPKSLDMEVNFEFNSAKLTTDAMLTLDQLGIAFNDPALSSARFRIAGHTDGIGSEAYNQKLSEQRAAAVKAYVVSKHGVKSARLETQGFGKSKLVDPVHPDAAINRRVQVTKLGG